MQVAMLVILLADPEMEPIATDSIRRLADLGVTRLGVFRDRLGVAIALEGWAYDPARSADATLGVVAAAAKEVRTLIQVADVAVSKIDARELGRRPGSPRGDSGEGRST
jgi:hypothetical protein